MSTGAPVRIEVRLRTDGVDVGKFSSRRSDLLHRIPLREVAAKAVARIARAADRSPQAGRTKMTASRYRTSAR